MAWRLCGRQGDRGGIILPDAAKGKPRRGMVVATSQGRMVDSANRVASEVKVGDRVIYSKYGGTEVRVAADKDLVVRSPTPMPSARTRFRTSS
jgi:chaperonin GroES